MPDYTPDGIDELLLNLVCRNTCKFYKANVNEKNREKYQCGAYLGLKKMLKEGNINEETLKELLKKITQREKVKNNTDSKH